MDQIQCLERVQEIPHDGPYCDLMWSDPEDILDWAVSPRGAGYLFGSKVTKEVSEGCSFSACSISHIYSHIYS